MIHKGYDLTIVYLDDFLIISKSEQACAEALQTLMASCLSWAASVVKDRQIFSPPDF